MKKLFVPGSLGYGLCLLLGFLAACSTANLLSDERRQALRPPAEDITIEEVRAEALRMIDPHRRYREGRRLRLTATDIWESTFIRWLTPLDQNTMPFQAELGLYHQGIEFTALDGDQKGRTIGYDGRSYTLSGAEKVYKQSSSISLYLHPLQGYLEWHQTLLRSPALELGGRTEISSKPYQVLYATKGSTRELETHDQYLVYRNMDTGQIDFIEFTLRDLMKSYTGVVHYRDYATVQGVLMPFWIGIGDSLVQPDFDHYFVVDSYRFDTSQESPSSKY